MKNQKGEAVLLLTFLTAAGWALALILANPIEGHDKADSPCDEIKIECEKPE